MAGFLGAKPTSPITGINVTPLVDITLVLLIVFLVTAKLVVSRTLPVDLPKAATGDAAQSVFAVTLQADGTMLIDGDALPRDTLLIERAQRALSTQPELRAVVQADGDVAHRRVMHALDLLRQAGVARVAFAVEPRADDARRNP